MVGITAHRDKSKHLQIQEGFDCLLPTSPINIKPRRASPWENCTQPTSGGVQQHTSPDTESCQDCKCIYRVQCALAIILDCERMRCSICENKCLCLCMYMCKNREKAYVFLCVCMCVCVCLCSCSVFLHADVQTRLEQVRVNRDHVWLCGHRAWRVYRQCFCFVLASWCVGFWERQLADLQSLLCQ